MKKHCQECQNTLLIKTMKYFAVNALTGEGLPSLVERAWYYVENYVPEPEVVDDTVYYEAKPDTDFVITRGR